MSERTEKKAILTRKAPAPVGPYSQGVIFGDTLYISGQIPLDPLTGSMPDGIEDQTHLVCRNLLAVASAAAASSGNFLKITIFLTDMGNFPTVNAIYQEYFGADCPPARACVEVCRLPKDVQIEMEAVVGLAQEG